MSIHAVADLEAHTGRSDDGQFQVYLDKAEAAVAAFIGAQTLVAGTLEYSAFPQRTSRVLVNEADLVWRLLTSLTSNGGVLDESLCIVEPWRINYIDPANPHNEPFYFGQAVFGDITTGYPTKAEMPTNMSLACLNGADWIARVKPDANISTESFGDYMYTLRQAPGSFEQFIPASSMALLRPYVRPDYKW